MKKEKKIKEIQLINVYNYKSQMKKGLHHDQKTEYRNQDYFRKVDKDNQY